MIICTHDDDTTSTFAFGLSFLRPPLSDRQSKRLEEERKKLGRIATWKCSTTKKVYLVHFKNTGITTVKFHL